MIPEKPVARRPAAFLIERWVSTMAAHNFVDLTGSRFGRLTVERLNGRNKHGRSEWRCRCDCGGYVYPETARLRAGAVKSCGCLQRDLARARRVTHDMTNHPLYRTWLSMKQRCANPANRQFLDYGGRGIRVCDAWKSDFAQFVQDMGDKPAGTTLDRIDVNGDYSPNNCRWADHKTQQGNRRPRLKHRDLIGHAITGWAYLLGI